MTWWSLQKLISNDVVISSEVYILWELLILTELEFSFPYPQWLAIGSYSMSDESSLHPHTLPIGNLNFNIILKPAAR